MANNPDPADMFNLFPDPEFYVPDRLNEINQAENNTEKQANNDSNQLFNQSDQSGVSVPFFRKDENSNNSAFVT